MGRQITSAIRAFQSPQAKGIFDFLKRERLIQTNHGGGEVVYLEKHIG